MAELPLSFADKNALEAEWEANLQHGRAFVTGSHEVEELAECTLVIERSDMPGVLELEAIAVMIVDQPGMVGVGIELRPFDDAAQAALRRYVETETGAGKEGVGALKRQTDIRALSNTERVRLAREGGLSDRVYLERAFGKQVWEALLANQGLTVPEVARIVRKGTCPRPLLDRVVDNATWARSTTVWRALLSNPRLSPDNINKLLRGLPKRELQQLTRGTAYSAKVRGAAKRMVGQG